ncbi:MAG: aminotransferase class III-fold pyridoxal phosphate-dependent enzyme [Armatimonadetes bacterium]|nr:aminotransferase class III-fold pyridoxal phosphate-dependent enzyme [Armatimonadota bacterium]MDE2207311.1 aminotransferase class III-fold pyridoxal phosphate-dependent enzyme [Armatimonadota bacterium]
MSVVVQTESDTVTAEARSSAESVIDLYKAHINPGLARLLQFGGFDDLEVSASGCHVMTASGRRYLDFLGGFGVFSLGHRHPAVVQAVHAQLDRMPLSTRTFFQEPQARLAERLADVAPGNLTYTFFSNSGTEAVEAALKIARIATGKTNFVSTIGAYHGKSMGSLAATGRDKFRQPFEPLVPGCCHVPYDNLDAAAAAVDERTAAIIIEPVQGEGGIVTPRRGYLAGLRRICDAAGILLIVDEVQTGLGRTGRMFACEHEGVAPDLLTLAKALGGGVMPIGATMGTEEVWNRAFTTNPYVHSSTFGGNQLACAAGLAAIQVIEDEDLAAAAAIRGEQLLAGLNSVKARHHDAVANVRGLGLMTGIEFTKQDYAEVTINGMVRRGVIAAYTLNNPCVIRMEPPLVVTADEIDEALRAIDEAIDEAVEMLADLPDGDA